MGKKQIVASALIGAFALFSTVATASAGVVAQRYQPNGYHNNNYGYHQRFVGRAYNVRGNSFVLFANGRWYTVYYSPGFRIWNSRGYSIGYYRIRNGDYVRVDGRLYRGVIYANLVRDLSR